MNLPFNVSMQLLLPFISLPFRLLHLFQTHTSTYNAVLFPLPYKWKLETVQENWPEKKYQNKSESFPLKSLHLQPVVDLFLSPDRITSPTNICLSVLKEFPMMAPTPSERAH